jgi:putative ABC transport system permease protein
VRLRTYAAVAARELRGSAGRIAFFAACLAVGVAAVVAVAGLAAALDGAIRGQARQLLAADLAVVSRRPIPEAVVAAAAGLPGARLAEVRELPSVVSVPAAGNGEPVRGSVLADLKAVGPGYPFYGEVVSEPAGAIAGLGDHRLLVAPELLVRLGLEVGDELAVGGRPFSIAGVVLSESDRMDVGFTIGPRVLLSVAGLERSGLAGLGSRVEHRLLVGLAAGSTADDLATAAAAIRSTIVEPEFVELETAAEAQPGLRSGLERTERFLGLVALLSLLIGGIGVAQAVRAWLAGRLDAIAVMRALGMRPGEVFALYLGQTALLAVLGSTVGAAAGLAVARAVPGFFASILPVDVVVGWHPAAVLRGVALGLGVAVVFALRPLVDAMRVAPVRVLRRDADPLPVHRAVAVGLAAVLVVGIALTAAVQFGEALRGFAFAGGLVVAAAVLAGSAALVVRLVGRAPREWGPVALRHGLAALARPGSGTLGAVVALGLGVLTVVGMLLIQQRLSAQLDADLPAGAPTVFLVDIQPDQWAGVSAALADNGAADVESVEVVIGRLASINGVPVAELASAAGVGSSDRRWVLTREQRLTSMAELPPDNVIIDGALWAHPDRAEVSIERDYARDLGVGVGDTLLIDIQGVPVELLVSSLRTVEWERFTINFFLVVEPGVLEAAPRFRIAAARLDAAHELPLQDRLAASHPNVTMIRLREVLERIVGVFEQLGAGIRFLGAFTVLAGIAILAGSVSAGAVHRGRQVALFKTLGMTRREVVAAFAVEYALVGLVAGVLGTVGALVMAYLVVTFGFQIAWAWPPAVAAIAVVATALLCVVAGLAASARALAVRPLAVLRRAE